MSLTSASGVVGGVKEYIYRGVQQLPIVLGSTSLLYTVTTGSMAHMNMFLGLSVVSPFYTYLVQLLFSVIFGYFFPNELFWKRGSGDTCNIIPSFEKNHTLEYFKQDSTGGGVIPSYWITSLGFFVGYSLTNATDTLLEPVLPGSNSINAEKRNTQATFTIIAIVIFTILILTMRLFYMRGCEGSQTVGVLFSLLAALGSGGIGYGMYTLSKACGARSSDLFGILSQILPPSSNIQHPIVCSAS
jgi:hypothetical protein